MVSIPRTSNRSWKCTEIKQYLYWSKTYCSLGMYQIPVVLGFEIGETYVNTLERELKSCLTGLMSRAFTLSTTILVPVLFKSMETHTYVFLFGVITWYNYGCQPDDSKVPTEICPAKHAGHTIKSLVLIGLVLNY